MIYRDSETSVPDICKVTVCDMDSKLLPGS